MFKGKRILITGGTGSLGRALTRRLLDMGAESVRVYSRNENNQIMMQREFQNDPRLRFLIGDVRDKDRLVRAMEGAHIVFHAAALKHVPVIEYNPFEAIKTNVIGSQNVIDACHIEKVELAVGIGTDKAVSPLNVYGATKLLMEKLFTTASNYVNLEKHPTKFVAIRYGNVLGSSGSVIPMFIEQILSKRKITITHPKMTRFSIMMNEALDFILNSAENAKGSETFVPKLRSYNIVDLRDTLMDLLGNTETEIIDVRPGEKLHEILINENEMRYTLENKSNYVIVPPDFTDEHLSKAYADYQPVREISDYSSDKVELIPKDDLKKMIVESGLLQTYK